MKTSIPARTVDAIVAPAAVYRGVSNGPTDHHPDRSPVPARGGDGVQQGGREALPGGAQRGDPGRHRQLRAGEIRRRRDRACVEKGDEEAHGSQSGDRRGSRDRRQARVRARQGDGAQDAQGVRTDRAETQEEARCVMDGWDEWGEGFEHEGESISVTFDEVTLFLNQFYIYTQSPEAYIKLRVF